MMILHNDQTKTPLSWYGGKTLMLDFLLPHFPPHTGYGEVFGGSGAALFAKTPASTEVYNDIDSGLANFYRVLKDVPRALKLYLALRLTPNSRQEHKACKNAYPSVDPVEWARQFFVLTRQSYCSIFNASWAYAIQSSGSSFHGAVELLPAATRRLQTVTVENATFDDLFDKYDQKGFFWYCDPPYLASTRIAESVYANEMTEADHRRLLSRIKSLKGMVVLSGYPSPLYDEALSGWRRITKDVRCYSSATTKISGRQSKPLRTECLWISPQAGQARLRSRVRTTDAALGNAGFKVEVAS